MPDKVASPIKWHGGKSYLAQRIIELMPPRVKNSNKPAPDDPGWVHYVEPFFGGGSVLFAQNPEGISEVVNDLNGELTNFWRVLQTPSRFAQFCRMVEAVPCSESEFNRSCLQEEIAKSFGAYPFERAVAFFVRNRQSRQALGKDFATLARTRTRRGMNELPSAWLSAIDGLPEVHARLQRVVVLDSQSAISVIRQQDDTRTLFYLDPPYMHGTRAVPKAYRHEMTDAEHGALLETLSEVEGRFLLSGYPSDLYLTYQERCGWRRVDIEIDNKASGKKSKDKEIECVWMNY